MLEAVIFDMDGVIVDTEPGYFEAVNEYLADFHVSISREFNNQLTGISYSRIWQLICSRYHLSDISFEEFVIGMERCRKKKIEEEGYIPIEGTLKLMASLKEAGIKMAIGSSSPKSEIENVIDAVNIRRYIDAFVSAGDECKEGKPNPEVILKAANRLRVTPGNCLVIEDASPGVLAAKRAGMYALGYQSGFGNPNFEHADYVVTSMNDADIALCRKITASPR